MTNFWHSEFLNPILEDVSGFEECRGFTGYSINTSTKQIIHTQTRRINHSRDPWSGISDIEFSNLDKNGDYFVHVPKHRIAGITHNTQLLYSQIEQLHSNHL
jgi:hypothetical protein